MKQFLLFLFCCLLFSYSTFAQQLSIGDLVWNDANGNGIQDIGEKGIPYVKFILWVDQDGDGKAEQFAGGTQADENGRYRFDNLHEGIYQVFVWEVDNFTPTGTLFEMSNSKGDADPDNDDNTDDNGIPGGSLEFGGPHGCFISKPFELKANSEPANDGDNDANTNLTIDFGFYKAKVLSIGDRVWRDDNTNGLQDAHEQGIGGVKLEIWKDSDQDGLPDAAGKVASTTTNYQGYYTFRYDI